MSTLIPIRNREGVEFAFARVDAEDVDRVNEAGTLRIDGRGYAVINVHHPEVHGRHYTLGLHRFIMGLEYGDPRQVDHKNHDILDNRKDNLIPTTHSGNAHNRTALDPRNQSGILGVSYRKELPMKPWYGRKMIEGKVYRTRYFATPLEAADALQELLSKRVAP